MGLTRKKQWKKFIVKIKYHLIMEYQSFKKEGSRKQNIRCHYMSLESVRIELVKLGISDNKIYIANYDAPQAKKLININRANSVQKIIKILYVGQIHFQKEFMTL